MGDDAMKRAILSALLTLSLCAGAQLNVRDFGAKGDGQTDDFPALQRVLDKAAEHWSRDAEMHACGERLRDRRELRKQCFVAEEIFLPRGTYRISRALTCQSSLILRGEKGAVIECADPDGLALYLELAYRCSIRGITFRNGANHIVFWTKNRDSAMVVIENCRFENSRDEAVFSESWRKTDWTPDIPYEKRPRDMTGCYAVSRDSEGLPVLTRTKGSVVSANSTLAVMRDCEFVDCGAAYRGSMDGQAMSRLTFRSAREQRLPVFDTSYVVEFSDISITANLPRGYAHGWFDSERGQIDLRRVKAVSTSGYGAPLYACRIPPRREVVRWWTPYCLHLEDCTVSAANSPTGVLVDFPRREPALLYVTGCREAAGRPVRLLRIGEVPKDLEDLRQVNHAKQKATVEESHRWMVSGNGPEIELNVPEILRPCVEEPLPAAAFAGFPALDGPIDEPCTGFSRVLKGSDFGLGKTPSEEDETARLQKLFDVAAGCGDCIVELPGRTFRISAPIRLPRRVWIRPDGRCAFHMPSDDMDILTVRAGDEPVAIELDDIVFRRGRQAFVASGTGRILLRRGVLVDGYGIRLSSAKRSGLRFTAIDSVANIRRFIEGDGVAMRLKDTWIETFIEGDVPHAIICRRGELLCEKVLGVPLPGENAAHAPERRPSFADGVYCAWTLIDDSVARLYDFRFGGEYGGSPIAEIFGPSRLLVEGNKAFWNTPCGRGSAVYNHDPRAKVTFNYVSMVSYKENGKVVGRGVRPSELYLGGCLNRAVRFDP